MAGKDLPEWTTEMDREILQLLNTELVLTPSVIADNIDRSSGAVARRLNSLEAGGLVEKRDRGKYKITREALETMEGGFKQVTTEEDIASALEEHGRAYQIYARDRDDWLAEEGRQEVAQGTYGDIVLGMVEEELAEMDEPIDYRSAIEAGIKKAEKYFKVVEDPE